MVQNAVGLARGLDDFFSRHPIDVVTNAAR